MSDNKKKHQDLVVKWAYRLKNGDFFKAGNRGSFSLASKPYSRKELTTKNLSYATFFHKPLGESPYLENFMMGGKWIKVTITSIYEWE